MRTTYRIPQPYAERFLRCADEFVCNSPVRPLRFMELMRSNTGTASGVFGLLDEEGLERKNPLIVALGDSVTAGHFEMTATPEQGKMILELFAKRARGASPEELAREVQALGGLPAMEITDARESYIEKFREMLIDKYELTSVSVINSGLAGDVLPSMAARARRDVIRYDPDLILINGSLNWDDGVYGDASVYKEMLRALVRRFRAETRADIVLLTPNGDLKNQLIPDSPEPTTAQRAEAIRALAVEEQVCLADARAVWEAAAAAGCPWEVLLANGNNHPSVEGHEVYAKVLMKLFE